MALSVSNLELYSIGNRRMHRFDVKIDASYTTGGETFSPGHARLRVVDIIIMSPKDGYLFEYDYANSKVKVICPVPEKESTLELEIDPGETAVKSSAVSGAIISQDGYGALNASPGGELPADTAIVISGIRCLAIGY